MRKGERERKRKEKRETKREIVRSFVRLGILQVCVSENVITDVSFVCRPAEICVFDIDIDAMSNFAKCKQGRNVQKGRADRCK